MFVEETLRIFYGISGLSEFSFVSVSAAIQYHQPDDRTVPCRKISRWKKPKKTSALLPWIRI